jgi:putative alpha-1,2-mannosidase
MLKIHEQMGWLPRWGYANFDTNIMTGDPVTPFLVDLWKFGALEGSERQAWEALWQNANGLPPAMSRAQGRAGNESYLARGFVAYDRAFPSKGMDVDPHHGGSATLEYALADCSLAQMASALGEDAAAATPQLAQGVGRGCRGCGHRLPRFPAPAHRGWQLVHAATRRLQPTLAAWLP